MMKPGAVLEVRKILLDHMSASSFLICALEDGGGRSLHPRSSDGIHWK